MLGYASAHRLHQYVAKIKMIEEEIYQKAGQVVGFQGMTVNERLFASGLLNTFDNAKKKDKALAELVLMALKVDRQSIDKILK
jgi:hypothetical protein